MSVSHKRRNLRERIEAIFDFIERQPGTFPKSRLKEIGLNPITAGKWLKLIEFIQNQPKIRLIQSGHNTLIEKTEGKYQALMRKMVTDESVPFEKRLQYSTDYLRSQYARERMESRDYESSPSRFPSLETIIRSLDVLVQLDPSIERYVQIFQQVKSLEDEGDRKMEFNNTVRRFVASINIKSDMKKILYHPSIKVKIQEFEEREPGFTEKVNIAKKILQSVFLI